MSHHETTITILRATAADLRASLDRVNDAIVRLQHAPDAPCDVTHIDPRFANCLSRGVPEGHDTVLGYLAKHRPDMLELMDYSEPCATARDGFWLSHRCKTSVFVPAPPVLREQNIMRVRCWPVHLLEQRFG